MLDLSIPIPNGKHQVLLVSAATAVSAFYLFSSLRKEKKSGFKEIPIPGSSLPIFGHLFSLGESSMHTIQQWNKELGPVVQLKMGTQTWFVLSDPFLAHEIFASNGLIASERPLYTFHNLFGHGGLGIAFSNPTKRWKKARTSVLEMLAPSRVMDFSDILHFESDHMVKQLLTTTAKEGQFNPLMVLNAASLNVVTTIVFAQRVDSVDDPLFKEVMDFLRPSNEYLGVEGPITQYFPALGFMDTLLGTKRFFRNYLATIRDPLIDKLIKHGAESDKDCLIKNFLEYNIDPKDLIVMMSDLILAGTDTAAITVSWFVLLVSSRPDIQEKLRTEIDAFYNTHHRLPTFKERDELPYMISAQKESMRYRASTVYGLPHMLKEDLVVRNYSFPKGAIFLPSMRGMHMNPDFYTDPETFNPERFLHDPRTMTASANGNINNRDHFNFGFGRRMCPGIHMAEVQVFNACVRIFARCVVAPSLDADGNEVPIDSSISLQAGIVHLPGDHEIRFLPRTDSPLNESVSA